MNHKPKFAMGAPRSGVFSPLGTCSSIRRLAPGPLGENGENLLSSQVQGGSRHRSRRIQWEEVGAFLKGLTLRDAVGVLGSLGLAIDIKGSGFVVKQEPAPGTLLSGKGTVTVWLE